MPVVSGVRFEVSIIVDTVLIVVVTILPPWKAFAASSIFGVAADASGVWQTRQVRAPRYLPFVGPAPAPEAGRAVRGVDAHSAVVGLTSYGAVAGETVWSTPG